jgi:hypothetical protein
MPDPARVAQDRPGGVLVLGPGRLVRGESAFAGEAKNSQVERSPTVSLGTRARKMWSPVSQLLSLESA